MLARASADAKPVAAKASAAPSASTSAAPPPAAAAASVSAAPAASADESAPATPPPAGELPLTEPPPTPPPPPPAPPVDPNKPPRATWHPKYGVEIEAHFGAFSYESPYGAGFPGGGARITVPVWTNGPIRSIDDEIAFGVGLDVHYYGAYKPGGTEAIDRAATTVVYVPLAVQWGFWLGKLVSIYVEPQLIYRYALYNEACTTPGIVCTPGTTILPGGQAGIRFRLFDHFAIVVRAGYPQVASIGLSWL